MKSFFRTFAVSIVFVLILVFAFVSLPLLGSSSSGNIEVGQESCGFLGCSTLTLVWIPIIILTMPTVITCIFAESICTFTSKYFNDFWGIAIVTFVLVLIFGLVIDGIRWYFRRKNSILVKA